MCGPQFSQNFRTQRESRDATISARDAIALYVSFFPSLTMAALKRKRSHEKSLGPKHSDTDGSHPDEVDKKKVRWEHGMSTIDDAVIEGSESESESSDSVKVSIDILHQKFSSAPSNHRPQTYLAVWCKQ